MVANDKSEEVTVTATDLLLASTLSGLLAPLRTTASVVRVRIVASSDVQNLTRREASVAISHIRSSAPPRHSITTGWSAYSSAGQAAKSQLNWPYAPHSGSVLYLQSGNVVATDIQVIEEPGIQLL